MNRYRMRVLLFYCAGWTATRIKDVHPDIAPVRVFLFTTDRYYLLYTYIIIFFFLFFGL